MPHLSPHLVALRQQLSVAAGLALSAGCAFGTLPVDDDVIDTGADSETDIDTDTSTPPPDSDSDSSLPDSDSDASPPDSDSDSNPPDSDSDSNPPDSDSDSNPPDSDSEDSDTAPPDPWDVCSAGVPSWETIDIEPFVTNELGRFVVCTPAPLAGVCTPAPDVASWDLANTMSLPADEDCRSGTNGEWCSMDAIPVCGPAPDTSAGCCYVADVQVWWVAEGRPFLVDGVARAAASCTRFDWASSGGITEALSDAPPAGGPADPAGRAELARWWSQVGEMEHASIAAFARFTLELLALGAPAALVSDACAAQADELRHAQLAWGLASRWSDLPVGPGPLNLAGAFVGAPSMASVAAAAVLEGCIGETIAAALAREAAEQASDPQVRAMLASIADDEARHAALAWRFVRWAMDQGQPGVREAIARAFGEGLAPMSPRVAQAARSAPGPADLRAWGCLPAAERAALAERVRADVVGPNARALLALPAQPLDHSESARTVAA